MNQSKTKSKVMIIALTSILLVCLLLVVSVVEIVQTYKYKKQIEAQERQIEQLQNAKDYYESKLDDFGYGENDFVFEEE